MNPIVRLVVKVGIRACTLAVAIGVGILVWLVYIGTPGEAKSVQFRGFVVLPKGDEQLTVLDHLTVSGQWLFVADESNGNVYRITLRGEQLPSGADVSVFPSEPQAHGVVLNESHSLAYVTRSDVNAVDVFDPAHLKAIARVPVAEGPDAIVLDPIHHVLYVANTAADVATLIDPDSHAVVASVPLPGEPEFPALDPQTGLMYQPLADQDALAEIDIGARAVKRVSRLDGCNKPTGTALDASTRRLFIGCAKNSVLAVFDLELHQVRAWLPIGKGPDSVVFDPQLRRIYTTGRSGVMSVIAQEDANTYRVLDTIHLHYGAHTLTVDPATHRIYVGYAGLWVPARVAVFDAKVRDHQRCVAAGVHLAP